MLKKWGCLSAAALLVCISQSAMAYSVCGAMFKVKNLTQIHRSLAGSTSDKIDLLLKISPNWVKIDSKLNVISQVRYRVWQPKKSKIKKEILLIGGLGQSLERFDQNPEFMKTLTSKGIKVVFLELPGQGHTSLLYELENGYSPQKISPKKLFPVLQSAIFELQKQKVLRDKKINIMGHSYGGWLVTQFLIHYAPKYISEVTLLDPGLKSFHNEGVMKWLDPIYSLNPFYKPMRNQLLADTLKYVLKKDIEHYQGDPKKLDNAVSLYLGIMEYNSIKNVSQIPRDYDFKVFIAERSEFGMAFQNMIFEFYNNLNVNSKEMVVLKDSPHNLFLFTPSAKILAPYLLEF